MSQGRAVQKAEKAPLQGFVAAILTERELAINLGSANGVERGMTFKVVEPEGIAINDPVTGKKLGTVRREKVRVQASEVHESYSLCRTYRTVGRTTMASLALQDFLAQSGGESPETLKVRGNDYLPPLPEEESFVKKGDLVIEVVEE